MQRNVEIKARVKDFAGLKLLASKVSDIGEPTVLQQEDVFYAAKNSRLKSRKVIELNHTVKANPSKVNSITSTSFVASDKPYQLIAYARPDQLGAKTSIYTMAEFSAEIFALLQQVLDMAIGRIGTVSKERLLYMVGQTRIHLDTVTVNGKYLGQFMELEVVLRPDQSSEDGTKVAEDLMAKLGIAVTDLIQGAYLDLAM